MSASSAGRVLAAALAGRGVLAAAFPGVGVLG